MFKRATRFPSVGLFLALLLACLNVLANDKDDDDSKSDDEEQHETVKAEKTPLTTTVSWKGVVEAQKTAEVELRLKGWTSSLIVDKAVEHGTPVKAGDTLIQFDAEKLEHAIRDAREERDIAQLAIRHAELELPTLQKQLPLDLAAAEREQKQAAEDLQRFLQVEKDLEIASAKMTLKSAEFMLEYSKEELVQLEKMYRDKDLTEETEEMILKRYKFQVESSEFWFRMAKTWSERQLTIDIPRQEEHTRLAATRSELSLSRARELLPVELKQKELALEKLRFDDQRAKERLAELEHDLALMTIKAPAAGVAYHGRYARGEWTGPQANSYLHGSTMSGNEVLFTVVSPGPLVFRGAVEEKDVGGLKVGQMGWISPTSTHNRKLPTRIDRLSSVPQDGEFDVWVSFDAPKPGDKPQGDQAGISLVPGMTGTVRIVTNRKESTLTVPESAVFEDEDAGTEYVYRQKFEERKDGDAVVKKPLKPMRVTVKVGLRASERVEILEGLVEGDEILESKP